MCSLGLAARRLGSVRRLGQDRLRSGTTRRSWVLKGGNDLRHAEPGLAVCPPRATRVAIVRPAGAFLSHDGFGAARVADGRRTMTTFVNPYNFVPLPGQGAPEKSRPGITYRTPSLVGADRLRPYGYHQCERRG